MIERFPQILTPSPDALESQVGDEIVILHLGNDTYYGLDAIGAQIWARLKHGMSLAQIRDELAVVYSVEPETIEADMVRFLDDLLRNDLLIYDRT